MRWFAAPIFVFCLTSIGTRVVTAQTFPTKPIRIVTAEPGGGNDIAARFVASGVSANIGQQVIVENRTGVLAILLAAKAQSDGYTLHLAGNSLWIAPLLRSGLSYDATRDFTPLILVDRTPNIIIVHPAMAVTSVKDLIAVAKAKSGVLNYASAATGSPNHLAAELFKSMAGVNIVRVTYKGAGPAVTAVLAGETQVMFASASSATSVIKSGKVRALAVTTAAPSILAPGLPTVAASGLPGYEAESFHAMFLPTGTPVALITRLNQEIARVLERPDIKERFFNAGFEAVGGTPQQLAAAMKSDMTRMAKVIKDAGIHED